MRAQALQRRKLELKLDAALQTVEALKDVAKAAQRELAELASGSQSSAQLQAQLQEAQSQLEGSHAALRAMDTQHQQAVSKIKCAPPPAAAAAAVPLAADARACTAAAPHICTLALPVVLPGSSAALDSARTQVTGDNDGADGHSAQACAGAASSYHSYEAEVARSHPARAKPSGRRVGGSDECDRRHGSTRPDGSQPHRNLRGGPSAISGQRRRRRRRRQRQPQQHRYATAHEYEHEHGSSKRG
eukprot:COSAG01_NODE_2784_length_7083_cov_306.080756_2_plen_245_part_00